MQCSYYANGYSGRRSKEGGEIGAMTSGATVSKGIECDAKGYNAERGIIAIWWKRSKVFSEKHGECVGPWCARLARGRTHCVHVCRTKPNMRGLQ